MLSRLVERADVLMENFRPGVMPGLVRARRPLRRTPPARLRSHPRFPSTSTLADAPAYDHVIQAMTGFAPVQADLKDGTPTLVQQAVVDKATGVFAKQAVTAALFERERTGRGQFLEIPMLRAGLSFLWPDAAQRAVRRRGRQAPAAGTNLPADAPPTATWPLSPSPRTSSTALRARAPGAARRPQAQQPPAAGPPRAQMRQIAAFLREKTTEEVIELLTAHGVPCAR